MKDSVVMLTGRLAASMFVASVVALCGCHDSEAEWRAFSLAHHCKIVDRQPGSVSYMSTFNGSSSSVIAIPSSGLSTYQCDGQVISRRED